MCVCLCQCMSAYFLVWGALSPAPIALLFFLRSPTHSPTCCSVTALHIWQVDMAEDLSCGQPVWTRDSAGLVVVAWPARATNFPALERRLGIVHCYNRPCGLHYVGVARNADGCVCKSVSVQY